MTRILWFHPRALLPVRGGGEVRTWGLVQLAMEAGHDVLLVQPEPLEAPWPGGRPPLKLAQYSGMSRLPRKLLRRGEIRSAVVKRSEFSRAERVVEDFAPEIAVVSELLSWTVAEPFVSGLPFVYDAHNAELDQLRSIRTHTDTAARRVAYRLDERRVARTETHLLQRASAILAVSDIEARRLMELGAGTPPMVAPTVPPDQVSSVDVMSTGSVVLFVGTLNYPPNIAAITELVGEVMPRVREVVPDARLHLVGRKPAASILDLASRHPWIDMSIDVPALGPAYGTARCAVIPMRSGAGTNVKVVEALSFGLPVVGTMKAIEGIPLKSGEDVLVGDDPVTLARHATLLLQDHSYAAQLGAAGRAAFTSRLNSREVSAAALGRAIRSAEAAARL